MLKFFSSRSPSTTSNVTSPKTTTSPEALKTNTDTIPSQIIQSPAPSSTVLPPSTTIPLVPDLLINIPKLTLQTTKSTDFSPPITTSSPLSSPVIIEEGEEDVDAENTSDDVLLATTTLANAIVCDICKGVSAYRFCEMCGDAFCSPCWASIHRGGKLATHTSYAIEQPPGVLANVDLPHVSYHIPRPEVTASAAKTLGESLVFQVHHGGAPTKVSEDVETARHNARLAKATLVAGERADRAELTIADVGRYMKRSRRLGNLPISLQMSVRLMPIHSVVEAVVSLTTIDAANQVGGWVALKKQPIDQWASGVKISGAGLEMYR